MIGIAFSFGLFSSLHCIAMCGPLQAVVMGQWLQSKSRYNWLWYHAGRFSTYMFLGILAASLGNAIGIPAWQSEATLITGITLLVGYFGFKLLKWDQKFYSILMPFLNRLKPKAKGKKGLLWYFSTGSINGLLPCGMVYAALLPAAASESIGMGAVMMLAFGLGTLPLLATFNLASNQLSLRFGALFQKAIPIGVVIVAILLIVRGLQLDIPYLSPPAPKAMATTEACG
jgi:hypothetical protein